jgi:putative ABC transport system permease protein
LNGKLILRDIQSNKGLWILSVLGIALGVAGWIGMKASADRAVSSFENSVRRTVGRATHVLKGQSGTLDSSTFSSLQKKLAADVSLVHENYARVTTNATEEAGVLVKVVGIDPVTFFSFYNLPDQVDGKSFPFNSFLRGENVAVATEKMKSGGDLTLQIGNRKHQLTVKTTLEAESNLKTIYVDIGLSQKLFEDENKITKILVRNPTVDLSTLDLSNDVIVRSAGTASPSVQSLLNAYALNLQALAFLSLFVGAFLVYNTLLLYSHRQNETLSLLRTLGMTSGEILRFTLLGVGLLGLVGTLLGLLLGLTLSISLSGYVVDSIRSIVSGVFVSSELDFLWSLGLGAAAGILVTLLGGLDPVLRNWSISPREWQLRSEATQGTRAFSGQSLLVLIGSALGLILVAVGGLILSKQSVVAGHLACFCLALAGASLTVVLLAFTENVSLPGQWLTMAVRNFGRHSVRSAVIVGSLVAAFSMVFAVTVLVDSFRQSVVTWSQGNIKAEHYISSVPGETTEADPVLDESFRRELRRRVGSENISTLRKRTVYTDRGHSLYLRGLNSDIVREKRPITLNESVSNPYRAFASGDVFLSEPGAYRLDKEAGDTLSLPAPDGTNRTVKIAGIFNDYTPKYAIVYLPDHRMTEWCPEARIRDLAVYDSSRADSAAIAGFTEKTGYAHQTREELKSRILELFERNFSVTRIMKLLATAIAAIGLTITLIAFNQTRSEFFGRLRASGAGRNHLIRLMSYEGLMLGGISLVGALPTGYALSYLLVNVINRRSFGWSIRLSFDRSIFLELVGIMLLSVFVALLVPAFRVFGQSIPSLLEES